MSIRSGKVFQLAADLEFEVIETQAREITPVQKALPPDSLWTFPPASVRPLGSVRCASVEERVG
jgi:hypothetical protein